MLGTIVNVIAVVAGSLLGLLVRGRLPEKVKRVVFQAIGLATLFLGVQMTFKTANIPVLFFSMLLGAVLGEAIDVEGYIERFGNAIKAKLSRGDDRFVEGFLSASLLFCMGSMAIIGSIEDGIRGDPTILYAKSMMDGFASISLASALGIGVLFSAIPIFLYQGGITLLASQAKIFFTEVIVNEISAAGGLILIGLAINLLEIRKIKIANMLPAIIFAAAITHLTKILGI